MVPAPSEPVKKYAEDSSSGNSKSGITINSPILPSVFEGSKRPASPTKCTSVNNGPIATAKTAFPSILKNGNTRHSVQNGETSGAKMVAQSRSAAKKKQKKKSNSPEPAEYNPFTVDPNALALSLLSGSAGAEEVRLDTLPASAGGHTGTSISGVQQHDESKNAQSRGRHRETSRHVQTLLPRRTLKKLLESQITTNQEKDGLDPEVFEQMRLQKEADAMLIAQRNRDRQIGRENLHEFVVKKREMFLLQHALGVKRSEIKKLEKISQEEERELIEEEKKLEEDAKKFDAILKENDKNSVEAIKSADAETKQKLEKIAEIKKLSVQIMALRAEMSKNEDLLKDYHGYRAFLERLTPASWIKKHKQQTKTKKSSASDDLSVAAEQQQQQQQQQPGQHLQIHQGGGGGLNISGGMSRKRSKMGTNRVRLQRRPTEDDEGNLQSSNNSASGDEGTGTSSLNASGDESDGASGGEEESVALYFQHPQQLLDIFAELEESNLELIQNCQESEETLEEIRRKIRETEQRMSVEADSLKRQMDFLNSSILKEEEKARQLEESAKFFSSSLSEVDQEKLLSSLNQKVKEVYRRCLGESDTNISTLQMLTSVENRLEQLFEQIEMMPVAKVERAERLKDKERRQRQREEKIKAQRILQEERVQRALERACAPVKKKSGKPVVFRSAPPQRRKKHEQDSKAKGEEDMAYYWE